MQRAAAAFVDDHLGVLGDLADELVLTGGATIGLWLDRPTARPARPTNDVDLIALVRSRPAYQHLAERLRARGLSEDATSGVTCRFRDQARRVFDVMPVDESILGFSNRFYTLAFEHAATLTLPSGRNARCVPPAILIATKLDAFGNPRRDFGGDHLASADMNDIVALLVGRDGIERDIASAPLEIRAALADWAKSMTLQQIDDAALNYALPGEFEAVRDRVAALLATMRAIAQG